MIKKTLKYTDIDGITREEDFYFNLTKAEVLELQVSRFGGFAESMQAIVNSKDPKEILGTIKEIILKAYGERAPESRHFIKTRELADAFSHTEAFSTLFMELFTDSAKAADFFNKLIPADMQEEARLEAEKQAKQPQDFKQKEEKVITVDVQLPMELTRQEMMNMSQAEIAAFVQRGGQLKD